jgi:hypothetical protein
MRLSPKHFALFVLLHVTTSYTLAQHWERVPWVLSGRFVYGYTQSPLGSLPLWGVDEANSFLCIPGSGTVLGSTDRGASLFAFRSPVERSVYGESNVRVADSNTIVIQTTEATAPTLGWATVSRDQGVSFDSLRIHGRFITNNFPILFARRSFIVATVINASNQRVILFSRDLGSTWFDSTVSKISESPYFGEADPDHVYVTDSTGAVEWSLQTGARDHRSLPKGAFWYRRLGPQHIIAQSKDANDRTSLLTSRNNGETWSMIDTMRFINVDTTLAPDVLDEIRRDSSKLSATFRFQRGAVISTTDGGSSWIYRGSTPRYDQMTIQRTHYRGTTNMPSDNNGYWVLPSGSTAPVKNVTGSPCGLPLQMSDSTILIAVRSGLYKSTDAGESWFAMGDEISPDTRPRTNDEPGLQPYEATRLWWGNDGRLWARGMFKQLIVDGSATRVQMDNRKVLSFTHPRSTAQRWFYRGLQDFDPLAPIREDGVLQSKGATSTPIAARVLRAIDVFPSIETIEIVPHLDSVARRLARTGAYFVWQTRSGEIVVVADSLLRSSDTGRTWHTFASAGLPVDQTGTPVTVTSFCEGPRGEWYVGTSGIIVIDSAGNADSSAQGGVLRSVDQGAKWHRIGGFPASAHVLHLVCDAYGNVFASTTFRTRDLTKSELLWESDYGASVYRITNDVASEIFSEFYSGPAIAIGRVLRRDHAENILYASITQGLQRTSDAGTTWNNIGTAMLDTLRILDIVVDSNDRVYAGTDKGVYFADVTMRVDVEDDDASRRTSVWCYPTPTSSVLRVRVNNIDLITTESPRLTISTLLGEHVLDLSDALLNDRSSKRLEFDVDLSALPRGVYGLLLWAGKSSTMQKVLIAR